MTLITRKQAASCTDSELRSLLAKLFNELASGRLDRSQRKLRHASVQRIISELSSRRLK